MKACFLPGRRVRILPMSSNATVVNCVPCFVAVIHRRQAGGRVIYLWWKISTLFGCGWFARERASCMMAG